MDEPISALPSASLPLAGTEPVPLVQGGITKQAPASAFSGNQIILFTGQNQSASIATFTLAAPTVDSMWLWNAWAEVAVADLLAPTVTLTLSWTDPTGGPTVSVIGPLDLSGSVGSIVNEGLNYLIALSGTLVTMTITLSAPTTGAYNYGVSVARLG